jgi:predicted membrane channel-forming protein YqfA (hemolysin III family)
MNQHISKISSTMDQAGGSVLSAALELFTQWSGLLGLALVVAAIATSVFTHKVPWTREVGVWLYLLGAAGCLLVHWTDSGL